MRDFIGYGSLCRLYKPVYKLPKYIFLHCKLLLKKVIEKIFFNTVYFQSSNFKLHDIKK